MYKLDKSFNVYDMNNSQECFKPTIYLQEGHTSKELREELIAFDINELKDIYRSISSDKFPHKPTISKLIDLIVSQSLYSNRLSHFRILTTIEINSLYV
jgi:hypothetical protein